MKAHGTEEIHFPYQTFVTFVVLTGQYLVTFVLPCDITARVVSWRSLFTKQGQWERKKHIVPKTKREQFVGLLLRGLLLMRQVILNSSLLAWLSKNESFKINLHVDVQELAGMWLWWSFWSLCSSLSAPWQVP